MAVKKTLIYVPNTSMFGKKLFEIKLQTTFVKLIKSIIYYKLFT